MAKSEGKTRKFLGLVAIETDILETFPYRLGDVKQIDLHDRSCEIEEASANVEFDDEVIVYETEEFSAVCPFSGLPDVAYVCVIYVPDKKVVELKSLKYYMMSFRDVGIYQEHVTHRLYKDLKNLLHPKDMVVKTVYNVRGGIDTTCFVGNRELIKNDF